ncbi:MAG: aspartate kinase [Nitrospinaceae bacterium]|nr:aspartate kinase [Nitrospinaceae bacterium]NIR57331.1 aspartate kinase [Nitrospinaceae bacterium]NIS87783.1 aspartate kinase [Nitrospinaceae bacterium]NIT84653.1 aspartate kinase [Nitrospinaceae bacterium]NIU46832.1 aspartate kinase [Nitrospinaceae bacterium]
MTSNLIVQKYGGTSVGTLDKIRNVARKVKQRRDEGKDVLVVVSAMAGETDKLLDMAHQLSDLPETREIDLLLSSGERISSALLSIALHGMGCPAVALTGRQMGLLTDGTHTRARIREINAGRAIDILKTNHVVVCAGFQGVNEFGDVTTLGRGGSDTSAVALAVALKAELCEIYTDVKGVYTADPRMVPDARKLNMVSFDEMLEMASLGARVLQIRCVEFANNFNMPIVVRSSFDASDEGTLICQENPNMEQPVVSGVMYDKNQSKITIKGVPDQPGIAANIFNALAEASISVDMIIQNVSAEGHTDISFTLATTHLKEAMPIMQAKGKDIQAQDVSSDSNISKISVVGAGMRSHAGVAARIFSTLSREKINIMMISTSEIRVSCIIEKPLTEQAVRALHEEFKLEKEPQEVSESATGA